MSSEIPDSRTPCIASYECEGTTVHCASERREYYGSWGSDPCDRFEFQLQGLAFPLSIGGLCESAMPPAWSPRQEFRPPVEVARVACDGM